MSLPRESPWGMETPREALGSWPLGLTQRHAIYKVNLYIMAYRLYNALQFSKMVWVTCYVILTIFFLVSSLTQIAGDKRSWYWQCRKLDFMKNKAAHDTYPPYRHSREILWFVTGGGPRKNYQTTKPKATKFNITITNDVLMYKKNFGHLGNICFLSIS